jgi:signal transduction histidine kinase
MNVPTDRLRVLNVRDDGPVRDARTRLLNAAGFEVVEADSAAETLRQAAAVRPHLVLLDVNLPDLDGYEVCRRLKSDRRTAGIPVLHLSAAQRAAHEHARGVDAGADGFLVEPVAPEVLLATVRSVARARIVEDAVRAAARQWQLTFDAITDGVCLLDRDGGLLRYNAVFRGLSGDGEGLSGDGERLAGRDGAAVLGRMLHQRTSALRGLLTPERRQVREFLVGSHWRQLTSEPVLDERGHVEGTLVILTDISERKRADTMQAALLHLEQQARLSAEASSRAKDEFLAALSHELRTPLTAALGWIRMLAANDLDGPTRAHALEVIERNTRLQAQIVEDLLDVSRIVSGKLTLELGDVAPGVVLAAATDAVRDAARAKDVDVRLEVDPAVALVRGDPGRLHQVFANLLSNAVKFTPAGGRVHVSAEPDHGGLRVVVRDTGRGIDPTLLPHLFEPFRQAEAAGRRPHAGLGLGLAIVRHLVALHGGRVDVASAGPDAGSAFTIWLPVEPPASTLLEA